jgi:hypothetical protein
MDPVHPRRTRRDALKMLGLGAVALTPALAPRGADAARAWCRTDPIIAIDGHLTDVFIDGPLTAPLKVTGPNQIVVTTPLGVPAWLVLSDLGFGRGHVVTFEKSDRLQVTDDGIEVKVRVYVPARDDSMPVRLNFSPRLLGILWPERAEGTANEWISLTSGV